MNTKRLVKVTSVVRRNLANVLFSSLAKAYLDQYQVATVRRLTLHETRKGFGLIRGVKMVEEAAEMVCFLVRPDQEDQAIDYITRQCELTIPGHGTVYSEEVDLIGVREWDGEARFPCSDSDTFPKLSPLMGISCVVQRGEANSVAKVALDMGSSVPCVSFGHGMGLRDRLGLLRVAIPAQKEIVQLVVSPYDAETMMRLMIRAGDLDRPGKGFIYLHPITKGVVDAKIIDGPARHVASMEQIIAALDELKGDMAWRKRPRRDLVPVDPSYLLLDLVDVAVTCNEGTGQGLVRCAMKKGAGGATITRSKCLSASGSLPKGVSSAREVCHMCVPRGSLEMVIRALEEGGVFGYEASGEIVVRRAPKAYTYF